MKVILWERRVEKGLTTRELSERSGISRAAINKIENEKASPTIVTLEALATALDCSVFDLLKEEE